MSKLMIAIATALLAAAPAQAAPIDDAKRAGYVGEQADGYLGVRPDAPDSARELARKINAERAERYAEIAAKTGATPAAVAAVAGQKLVDRAPPGEWVRDADGTWRKL